MSFRILFFGLFRFVAIEKLDTHRLATVSNRVNIVYRSSKLIAENNSLFFIRELYVWYNRVMFDFHREVRWLGLGERERFGEKHQSFRIIWVNERSECLVVLCHVVTVEYINSVSESSSSKCQILAYLRFPRFNQIHTAVIHTFTMSHSLRA